MYRYVKLNTDISMLNKKLTQQKAEGCYEQKELS